MDSSISLADLRKEYTLQELTIEKTASEPFLQFKLWFDEAIRSQVPEPNAMHLSTVSPEGKPSGRIVLLKGLDSSGFMFYTNYNSRKAAELAHNPWASLTFFWPQLERQIRITGKVTFTSAEDSNTYYHSRPRGSQLGAWVSPQSQIIPNRHVLEQNLTRLEAEYGQEATIPRPPYWGGYCVMPDTIEFWQGRSSRLHDRIEYSKLPDNTWQKNRLAP